MVVFLNMSKVKLLGKRLSKYLGSVMMPLWNLSLFYKCLNTLSFFRMLGHG